MNQICQLLEISKKTYYQSQEPQERLSEKYQALRPVLNRLIEKHPSYGMPRLKQALAEQEGIVVNAKLLRKLLRVWGLNWQRKAGASQRKKTWVQRVVESLGERANLVRHLQITACFQVLGWELSLHPDTL